MQSGGRGWAKGRRTVTLKEDGDAALTSLDAMEREVGVMHPERVFTAEGIDITGLPPDLQKAVRQRRSTKEQYVRLMEERRRQRLEREKKASQQVDVPGGSSSGLSPRERLLAVLASYRASSPEQEVVAIRVKLPGEPQFTVPYDVFLRTALHKDVICGSRVSPTRGPHSLVHFGRLVIKDVPPLFHPPPPVKQCEVEGHIPPVVLHVEGAVFAAESFSSSQIILEEIQNPHLPPIKETAKLGVGLLPCLREMLDGATAIVTRETMKDVALQLNYCPSFQMLSSDEYDVRVDSEELLRRLQHPRYLRIVIKNALRPDSFTSTTKGNPTDVNVTIEVRPTIARLHLRAGEELLQRGRVPYFPRNTTRPMLVCESTLREEGFELGIELVGDQWTLDHTGRQSSSPWMEEGNDTTEHQKENITSSESTLVNSFSVVGTDGPRGRTATTFTPSVAAATSRTF
ncbi:hypothetical protein AGDE_06871 [Angomonas deanei]|uniref:Uncharacterized protein n=1 Tax=Angomonas deanei TaxID=59799 RepID=A0A7G2CPF0_9TRYP|nr:hypothetical protein AGDE_06871 [Angomonas deanei]CAD2221726.1 hypothetical protein, conserved [Angomonas deanei]|eukprot:EPY36531.1 hypothetical protein AGDE_06871 [Angomonas deanei]